MKDDAHASAGARKRLRRWETPNGVRFVTFSCEQRLPLLGRAAIRDVEVRALATRVQEHECELFVWAIMPEHVHLIARPTGDKPLGAFLESFKKSVTQTVLRRWRTLNAPILDRIRQPDGSTRFWLNGGGFDRNIRDVSEFCQEVQYIHQNPVIPGLVESPNAWKWSSALWWLGDARALIACQDPPWIPRAMRNSLV